MPQVLGRLTKVDPRTIWKHEALDFTPWLAEHIDELGETLGLDLELVQREVPMRAKVRGPGWVHRMCQKARLSSLQSACLVVVLLGFVGSLRAGEATGLGRTAASLFGQWCLEQELDLKEIDRKATLAHYEVSIDRRIPLQAGQEIVQKNWIIRIVNGAPIELTTTAATNGSLHVLGCGIYAPDLYGQAMEAELSRLPRMGMPTKHPPPIPAGTTVWWAARVGPHAASEDSEVIMSRDVPNVSGVAITLIYKIHMDKPAQAK
jgi:hypothetical protein